MDRRRISVRVFDTGSKSGDRALFDTTINVGLTDTAMIEIPVAKRRACTVAVWADAGGMNPPYDISDFASVVATGTLRADCFAATAVVVPDNKTDSLFLSLKRPVARLDIIAADSVLPGHTARLIYNGFVPSAFSLFADRAVDATASPVTDYPASGTELICRDHLFAPPEGTATVSFAVEILDPKGKRKAISDPVTAELRRGCITVVKGRFFSATGSGVTISTDFEGDYNIRL